MDAVCKGNSYIICSQVCFGMMEITKRQGNKSRGSVKIPEAGQVWYHKTATSGQQIQLEYGTKSSGEKLQQRRRRAGIKIAKPESAE